MNFDGSVTIKSKIDTVWDFLTDPHLVSQCAPGVKEVEVVIPDKQFRTNVGISLGAVKVSFAMDVEWIELDENGKGGGGCTDVFKNDCGGWGQSCM